MIHLFYVFRARVLRQTRLGARSLNSPLFQVCKYRFKSYLEAYETQGLYICMHAIVGLTLLIIAFLALGIELYMMRMQIDPMALFVLQLF